MIKPNYNNIYSTSCKRGLTVQQKIKGCKGNIQQCKTSLAMLKSEEVLVNPLARQKGIKRFSEQIEVYKHALKGLERLRTKTKVKRIV